MIPKDKSLIQLPAKIKKSIKSFLVKSSEKMKELAMERWADDGGAPNRPFFQKRFKK